MRDKISGAMAAVPVPRVDHEPGIRATLTAAPGDVQRGLVNQALPMQLSAIVFD